MKIVAIVEARMSSSRLPGKVLLPVCNKPLFYYLIERLKLVSSLSEIVIATTINSSDQPIADFAKEVGVSCFRGSEDDVMKRVLDAANYFNADIIVSITGDCPIIDPSIIEQCISVFLNNNSDFVSNATKRSYPDGMDTQVYWKRVLQKSYECTNDILDHEHVTLHIRNNPEMFSQIHLMAPPELYWPELGLTLDEMDDYLFLKSIIENFSGKSINFSCLDVISFLKKNQNLLKINANVGRKGDS